MNAFPEFSDIYQDGNGLWSVFTKPGLTKRELFIAMMLQAIVARGSIETYRDALKEAVQAADALLVELEKREADK